MYYTAYGTITLVRVPRVVFSAALALGYDHLGDFETSEGALRSAKDLRTRVPWSRIADTNRACL